LAPELTKLSGHKHVNGNIIYQKAADAGLFFQNYFYPMPKIGILALLTQGVKSKDLHQKGNEQV
jgi:hypothetical protein